MQNPTGCYSNENVSEVLEKWPSVHMPSVPKLAVVQFNARHCYSKFRKDEEL